MKLVIPTSALKQALATALPFREQRSHLAILQNVQLQAAPGELLISATNLSAGITVQVPCMTERFGATTVQADALAKIVGMLEGKEVILDADPATVYLGIASGSYRGKLLTTSTEDFPIVPTTIADDAFDAPANLVAALNAVTKTASKDESRPTLTCVKCTIGDGHLDLASTDGYRLTVINLPLPTNAEAPVITALAPAKTLESLARIAKDADTLRLHMADNKFTAAVIADEQTSIITCFTMDATFPDYQVIIPKTYNSRAIIPAAALARATKMALLTYSNANTIGYEFTATTTRVTGTSDTQSATIDLPATLEGPAIEMAFNGVFLIEALTAFQGEVVIEMTQPTRPALIYAANTGKEAHMAVIMPMMSTKTKQTPEPEESPNLSAEPVDEDEEPEEPEPAEPEPVEPEPVEPTPVEPEPVKPTPTRKPAARKPKKVTPEVQPDEYAPDMESVYEPIYDEVEAEYA